MKVLILAGGFGTRLGEETTLRPKPMVEIGAYPILWHIMKIYSHYGFNDFIVLCGYKGCSIKEYFVNYYMTHSDIEVDLKTNSVKVHKNKSEPWNVTLLDTGLNAMTGCRIKRAREYVGNEPFMLTYGDGVSDVDILAVLESHRKSGKLATVTAVQPAGRWGALEFSQSGEVGAFQEKPQGDSAWINGGFFVCQPEVFDYIPDGENAVWEHEPLKNLVRDNQLNAFKHAGFWQPMDMMRDKEHLNKLWNADKAPWKVW